MTYFVAIIATIAVTSQWTTGASASTSHVMIHLFATVNDLSATRLPNDRRYGTGPEAAARQASDTVTSCPHHLR